MWSLRTPKGQSIAVVRLPAVVGSASDADVLVPHDSVAAKHARLAAGDDDGLLVEALGDAVVGCGGRRVTRAVLQDGDELILGRLRFTLVRSDPARATRAAPGASRIPAGATRRPATAARTRPAAAELLVPRDARKLPTRLAPGRRGLLHADLSQYTIGMRLLIAGALLLVCAGLVYAISLAFGLVG
jgi:hypothetical protein